MRRQTTEENGVPCSSTSGSPSPSAPQRTRSPRKVNVSVSSIV